LHLKDYMVDAANNVTMCEIGAGNLDWPGIVRAAEDAGCRWFIVEQDTCPGDPVDSLEQSFRWLAENICQD
jgi:sugar phosphate isomerase/epimerase